MEYVSLGKTGLLVSRTSFGALPIQRVKNYEEASKIIRTAYDNGINFFDTARLYSDSEEKIGFALSEVRSNVIIATKTMSKTKDAILNDLETSLEKLNTDYIDIYQLHNPPFAPKAGGEDGIYETLLKAKKAGKIRFIGLTNHSCDIALDAALSGLYDTIQYPFSMLSSQKEINLATMCASLGIGFIAMKALCGGLLTNIPLAFSFLRQFENVVPIWGIQKIEELNQLLSLEANPPKLSEEFLLQIEKEKTALMENFCRGCGYCLPCPAGIPIENANRMSLMLRRAPKEAWLTKEWKEKMALIENCTECKACEKKCPYHLKPYLTLKENLLDFNAQYAEFHKGK